MSAQTFMSPAVVREHALRPSTPRGPNTSRRLWRKFRLRRYMGSPRSPAFTAKLVRLALKYPLCRFCLLVPGRICEHSHPHEASPRRGEIPARALTACAKCNAAERETLKTVCQQHGRNLRRMHVSRWPADARRSQTADLARRINALRAAAGRSPMPRSRFARILKFAP